MRCLVCGIEIDEGIVCQACQEKITEEMCFKVAQYDVFKPDNRIWEDVIRRLDNRYSFRNYSLELADYIPGDRKNFVKIYCMKLLRKTDLSVLKKDQDEVITKAEICENSSSLSDEEKNLIRAILLGLYLNNRDWDNVSRLYKEVNASGGYFEPYFVLSNYYMKIRNYDKSVQILNEAKTAVSAENLRWIDELIEECNVRKAGKKQHYKPEKRADIIEFYKYLDSIGIEHETLGNDKRGKVREKDFKPLHRYERSNLPDNYVAFWITSEFYVRSNEPVEMSAVKVENGVITGKFHEYMKPINKPKNPKYVSEELYLNAPPISEVFPRFLEFAEGGILASVGFYEQHKMLSRLARYSQMDEIYNEILDVIEFYDSNTDDLETYTRESILEKYEISEGNNGEEKAVSSYELIEKMRK